jgi:hypothetical protein
MDSLIGVIPTLVFPLCWDDDDDDDDGDDDDDVHLSV